MAAGHLYKMALEEAAGAKEVEGVEVTLLQVRRSYSSYILAQLTFQADKASVEARNVSSRLAINLDLCA